MSHSAASTPTSPRRHSRGGSLVIPNRQMDRQSHDNVFLWSPEGRTRFVELVALQSLLSKIPIELEHQLAQRDTTTTNSSWRLLPPKVEKEVADYFAFLTAADSGSECVSAACIEERRGGGVVFRIAMNEAVPRRILEEVRGFCDVLQRVANKEKNEHAGRIDMWDRVVEAEERKVVRSLKQKFARGSSQLPELFRKALGRSKGDRGTGDMNFYASSAAGASGDSLPSGVTSMTGSSQLKDAGSILETIYAQCQDVVRGDVNGGRVGEEVRRLLDTCYQARKSKSFKAYLTKTKCPKSLMQTIEKLGRYKAASYHLVSMAKKYPSVFNSVEVQAVEPPIRGALPPPTSIDHGLAQLASELTGSSTDEAKEKIMSLTGISERTLEISFEDIYLTRPHVHAEMQMVKFYEENPSINPPYFIGLSKKSCYLCNLFLHYHGQFSVSKTHPSIYLKWSLPPIACKSTTGLRNYAQIMEQMTAVLEKNCKRALNFDPALLKEKRSRRRKSTASVASSVRSVEWAPASRPQSLADLNAAVRLAGERLGMSVQDMQAGIVTPRRPSIDHRPSMDRSLRENMDQSRPVTSNGTASRASTKKDQDWPSRTSSPRNVALPSSVLSSRAQTPRALAPQPPKFQRHPTQDEVAGGVPLSYESGRTTPIQYPRSELSGAQYPLPRSELSAAAYALPASEVSGAYYAAPRSEASTAQRSYPRSEVSGLQYHPPASEVSGVRYPLPASEISGPQYPGPRSEVSGVQYHPPSSVGSFYPGSQYPVPPPDQYPGSIHSQYPSPTSPVSPYPDPPSSVSQYPAPPSQAPPPPPKIPITLNSNAGSAYDPHYPSYPSPSPAASSRLAPPSNNGQKTRFTSVEALTGATSNHDSGSTLSQAATASKSRLRTSEPSALSAVGSTRYTPSAAPEPIYELESPQIMPLRVDKGKGRERPSNPPPLQTPQPDKRDLLSPLTPVTRQKTRPKTAPSPTGSYRRRGPLNLTIERNANGKSHYDTQYTIYLADNHSSELSAGDILFRGTIDKPTERSKVIQCKGFRLRSSLRNISDTPPAKTKSGRGDPPLRVRQVSKSKEKMVMDISFSDATVRLEVFWDE